MISAIFSCMNREYNLAKGLPSWLKYEEIGDIVIVDWSSKTPLLDNEFLCGLMDNDPRIKLVRVSGEKVFNLAKSYNLAFKFTDPENKILLKLDCDYLSLNRGWADNLELKGGELNKFFVTGIEHGTSPHFCGLMLINKKDFLGYNENFQGWGYDDNDLYKRLQGRVDQRTFGGTPVHVRPPTQVYDYVHHFPHGDDLRVENYEIKDREESHRYNESRSGSYWTPKIYRILKRESQYVELEFFDTPFPE